MAVLFKMSFTFADSMGLSRSGVAVTDQHTHWNHAEKELVRACRAIKGYQSCGEVIVASPAHGFHEKLKGDGCVYLEYIGEDGKKVSELVQPNADEVVEEVL